MGRMHSVGACMGVVGGVWAGRMGRRPRGEDLGPNLGPIQLPLVPCQCNRPGCGIGGMHCKRQGAALCAGSAQCLVLSAAGGGWAPVRSSSIASP